MSTASTIDIIECPNNEENVFVLRYPLLDKALHVGTKLFIKQNQVAVITCENTVLDVLTEGVHVLDSKSLPKFAAHAHWVKGFKGVFKCSIYFVSLTSFGNIKWAMVNSLIIRDNDFGSVPIKCFGNFAFKVSNAEIFMNELFGKIKEFNDEDISLYLKTLVVKGITDMILETRISALDFAANYDKFEMENFKLVREIFAKHGLFLQKLQIEAISLPENYEKLVNIKVQEKIEEKQKVATPNGLPINHPINAGTIHTSEMKKLFNFTHDLTITCVSCGATISKNFKFCPQCGEENKETAKECPNCHNIVAFKANYCPDCGTKLFDKNKVILCKYCGKIVSENDIFCPDCGKPL